ASAQDSHAEVRGRAKNHEGELPNRFHLCPNSGRGRHPGHRFIPCTSTPGPRGLSCPRRPTGALQIRSRKQTATLKAGLRRLSFGGRSCKNRANMHTERLRPPGRSSACRDTFHTAGTSLGLDEVTTAVDPRRSSLSMATWPHLNLLPDSRSRSN